MTPPSPNRAGLAAIFEAFDRAPVGEPFTPEQRAELDQIMADIGAGKIATVPHAEVHAWVVRNGGEEAEFAAE
jgi:hypothetical protein